MTRRLLLSLLLGPGLLVLASIAPSPTSALQDKISPSDVVRLGSLGNDGSGALLEGPVSIALDDRNHLLYLSCAGSSEVVVLDQGGRMIRRIGPTEELISPYGVAVDSRSNLYVSESTTGLVKVFDLRAQWIETHDLSALRGHPVAPGRITCDDDGVLCIIDMSEEEVLVLSPTFEIRQVIPTEGRPQKAMRLPDGDYLVSSARGAALRRFGPSGKVLSLVGGRGDDSPDRVSFPGGFGLDSSGRIWLTDSFRHRVQVFAKDGEFLMDFGRLDRGEGEWGFLLPADLCLSSDGTLYVLEKGANRIQVFRLPDPAEGNRD